MQTENIERFTMKEARYRLSDIFDLVRRGVIVEVYNDRRAGKPVVCRIVAPNLTGTAGAPGTGVGDEQ